MQNSNNLPEQRQVLAFNPLKRLCGVFGSLFQAAAAFGTTSANIHSAINGNSMTCCKLYWRYWDKSVLPTLPADFLTLQLEIYDKNCGLERKYYPTGEITRKGMKYKKRPKQSNTKPQPPKNKPFGGLLGFG